MVTPRGRVTEAPSLEEVWPGDSGGWTRTRCPDGGTIFVARTAGQRLLGLMGLRAMPPGSALLFPDCGSVHTAWMRMAIDVVFLDADGRVLAVRRGLRAVARRALPRRGGGAGVPGGWRGRAAQRAVLPRGDAGLTRKIGVLRPLLKTPVAGVTK